MKHRQVYEQLQSAIYSGRIRPGDKLVERKLAEEFQTSRVPLRESLARLVSEGLIRRVPGETCYVEDLTMADVREIWLMRSLLEPAAARFAAERAERGVVERLLELADRMADELQQGHDEASATLDLEFHRVMVNASRSPRLIRAYDLTHVPMLMSRLIRIQDAAEELREQHQKYALLIGKGDAAGAEQFAREHVAEVSLLFSGDGKSKADRK